ncbi:MAG TPA: LuxR C-terminal-related transcriptional regulator, partial [Caulobacteraceae bacterium]
IAAATFATGARPSHRSLVLRHGHAPTEVRVVDVIRLPVREFAFGFEPRVLVAVRGERRTEAELPALLADAFSLTNVEATIAVRLAQGEAREAIAAERDVSVETVRSHIKKIFAKLDVRREAELAARLRQLS